jgi:hypothetical protein
MVERKLPAHAALAFPASERFACGLDRRPGRAAASRTELVGRTCPCSRAVAVAAVVAEAAAHS